MELISLIELGLQAFRTDRLAVVMAGLILFVTVTVTCFSRRYMAGDRNYARQARDMVLLGACVLVMVFADHLLVLMIAWALSNLLLVRLMVHKKEWKAAYNSGMLALTTFGCGFLMLAPAFWILSDRAGTTSLHAIVSQSEGLAGPEITVALLLIALAAMTQSAAWPFHRWLLSSLNSPTPVSALMHAGLVNGGGFLLVRFAPLYLTQPMMLHGLFIAGLITAILGTMWKLIQTDIKRMLACSTMGQMGFMIMQCGMGMFAPAVSHLCWHGLFKAYLFLSVGSTVHENRRKDLFCGITFSSFVLSCLLGAAGAYAFMLASGNAFLLTDTSGIMVGMAFMSTTQLACNVLEKKASLGNAVGALALSIGAGGMYGISLHLVETALAPLSLFKPQTLDAVYVGGFGVIFLIWLMMNFNITARFQNSVIWKRLYVAALNGSQPHPTTITLTRTSYHY